MGKANLNSAHLIMFSLLVLLLPATTYAWRTTAGGVGDHSTHCSDAVDFEACFATCPYGRLASSPICCTKGSGNTITGDNYCDSYSDPGCPGELWNVDKQCPWNFELA